MYKQVFLIGLFVLATFSLSAQRRQMDPTKMAERQTTALQERFTEKGFALDEATLEQVKALHLKYAEQSKTIREENKGDREAMRSAMESINGDRRKEFKALLTKEQFKEFKALEAEQRAKRQERGGRGGPGNF